MSVAFIFGPPGNKDAVAPNPLTKEESRRVYKCDDERLYQGQLNAGFSKVCEIFKVGIESLKYIREFHTQFGLLLWRHFHAPKRDAKRNEL